MSPIINYSLLMVAHTLYTLVDPVKSPLVVYRILRTIKKSNNCTWSHAQKSLYFKLWPLIGRCSSPVHHNRYYSLAPGPMPWRHLTVNLGKEINATKGMIKNAIQQGSEPGSPDYRSDTLATRWQRG